MENCKNCNETVTTLFCGNCGHALQLKRVDAHYILHEIQHILHFEKGILYTIKELLIRPGKNIREFITDNRNRLVKPILFIIVSSFIYTLAVHFFHVEKQYIHIEGIESPAIVKIFSWIQHNYGYANIIMGAFISLWLKLFFKKYGYNFFEILILLCFVIGVGMLIFSVLTIITGLTKIGLMNISGMITIAYSTWAIGQFFDKKKPPSYFKALMAYLLGMMSFTMAALLIGLLVDTL